MPKEETISIPLKYFDVTRSTHTDLVFCKQNVLTIIGMSIRADICQTHGEDLQSSLCWKRNPPKRYMWSGWRLTKIQATTRPDHAWPEVWTKIGKAAQNREKQERAKEKPKLDNAQRLRGIYFIDPDDEEYKETLKNETRKLERSMAAAMPCKKATQQHHEGNCEAGNWIREEFQNSVWLYSGISGIHKATSGIF